MIKDPKYLVVTLFVFGLGILVHSLTQQQDLNKFISGKYKVIKKTSMGPIIIIDGNNVLVKTKKEIDIGDIIWVKGKINLVENKSKFDLVTYLKSLNVKNIIKFPSVFKIERTDDIRVNIRNFILSGGDAYNKITPLLFLGIKTPESKEVYNIAIKMNIVHLFVISGFHISLFFLIISKILKLFKVKENIASWISLIPIVVYLFLLGFPISATRASMLVVLSVVNKTLLKGKFKTLTILSVVMAVMFIWKPRSIYSLSFIFTFIATYVVIIVNSFKFVKKRNKYISIALFAYLSNFLPVVFNNGYISIFGIIYGVVLSPVFVFMYVITLFLFPFKDLMEYIDMGFIYILKFFNNSNILININKFSIYYVFYFYWLIASTIIVMIWNSYTVKRVI